MPLKRRTGTRLKIAKMRAFWTHYRLLRSKDISRRVAFRLAIEWSKV